MWNVWAKKDFGLIQNTNGSAKQQAHTELNVGISDSNTPQCSNTDSYNSRQLLGDAGRAFEVVSLQFQAFLFPRSVYRFLTSAEYHYRPGADFACLEASNYICETIRWEWFPHLAACLLLVQKIAKELSKSLWIFMPEHCLLLTNRVRKLPSGHWREGPEWAAVRWHVSKRLGSHVACCVIQAAKYQIVSNGTIHWKRRQWQRLVRWCSRKRVNYSL